MCQWRDNQCLVWLVIIDCITLLNTIVNFKILTLWPEGHLCSSYQSPNKRQKTSSSILLRFSPVTGTRLLAAVRFHRHEHNLCSRFRIVLRKWASCISQANSLLLFVLGCWTQISKRSQKQSLMALAIILPFIKPVLQLLTPTGYSIPLFFFFTVQTEHLLLKAIFLKTWKIRQFLCCILKRFSVWRNNTFAQILWCGYTLLQLLLLW